MAAAVAVAALAYTGVQDVQRSQQAKGVAHDAEVQQRRLQEEQKRRAFLADAMLARRASLRATQDAARNASTGRSGTVTTSPLGLTGTPQPSGKTLLGI
jgi:hypothetical protein